MQCKLYLLCSSLLLATLQLQRSSGHPLPENDTDRELETFKDALQRLEEEVDLIEALQLSPDSPKTRPEERPQPVTPEESRAPDTRATRNNPVPDSLLKGLRTLQIPRMMRGSGCFGSRMDRIDALSGMGCNGFRRY